MANLFPELADVVLADLDALVTGDRRDGCEVHMENRLLDYLASRVIPGSILTHYLFDDGVAKEVARLIDEHLPGTRPRIDVTKSLIVVTWSGAPYDDVLQACFPFNSTGLFAWKGETFDHKPLFLRRRR